jgi:hypothetical protein
MRKGLHSSLSARRSRDEDLQHLIVAVMQKPWADTCFAVRRDEVDAPSALHAIDQDSVHSTVRLKLVAVEWEVGL